MHVRSGAHPRRRADQHAHRSVFHRVEQLSLVGVVVEALDEGDFVGRNALGDESVLDVLVGVPSALLSRAKLFHFVRVEFFQKVRNIPECFLVAGGNCRFLALFQGVVFLDDGRVLLRLGHATIEEHKLCPLVRRPLVVDGRYFVNGCVQLSARFVVHLRRHCFGVQRQLARLVHQAQASSVAHLDVLDVRKALESRNNAVHQDAQLRRRRLYGNRAPIAALDLRQREFLAGVVLCIPPLDIVVGHHVGYRVVPLHQGAHVRPLAAQASDHLQADAGICRLKFRQGLDELTAEGVEVLKTGVGKEIRGQIPHDGVHLDGAVRDRRPGHEHRGAVHLADDAHLGVQIEGLARSC